MPNPFLRRCLGGAALVVSAAQNRRSLLESYAASSAAILQLKHCAGSLAGRKMLKSVAQY